MTESTTQENGTAAAGRDSSELLYEDGQKVRLLKDIWDDGQDHHPPGYLAHAGEILVIRTVRKESIGVSHEDVLDNSFVVFPGEFELVV